jgi:hypothetical protein
MNSKRLFEQLLAAEGEREALEILNADGLLDDASVWRLVGDRENNFSIVGNQHSDATGAMTEKIINAIDAVLMAGCYRAGLDPEGAQAPPDMGKAVERFFGIREGRLGDLPARELTKLADAIHLVAVGSKADPSFLIIDRGEGQTPDSFPQTFMSLAESNKLRIPFVQGKFNSGGTGVLPFCGNEHLQLIASRRNPDCPSAPTDQSREQWGFTIVRRLEPTEEDRRKSSMYVYLAPGGAVPRFNARALDVLPGESSARRPPTAYASPLEFGTVVKLYNYRWRAKSMATTEARFELEKYLHAPCLPFRITESRDYRANYYSTTVAGVWASAETATPDGDNLRVEEGFPSVGSLEIPRVGHLSYRVAVFKADVDSRRIPKGVFFDLNGQAQGALPADFIPRRLGFEFLRNHLLVSVDCSGMRKGARENLFMAARDRLRRDYVYDEVVAQLETYLKAHPGLRALNSARLNRAIEKGLSSEEDIVATLNQLLQQDPGLRRLFNLGDRLVSTTGPVEAKAFVGRRFPTFFDMAQGPAVKHCPVNHTVRVEFATDAANNYFDRSESPGSFSIVPEDALAHENLWNGVWRVWLKAPEGTAAGDRLDVTFRITDPDRESRGKEAFGAQVVLEVAPAVDRTHPPGPRPPRPGPGPKKHQEPELGLPEVAEIRRDAWDRYEPHFSPLEAMRVIQKPNGEGNVYVLNLDNTYLLTDLRSLRDSDKSLATYWFKWGLLLCALGAQKHFARLDDERRKGNEGSVATPPDMSPIDAANIALAGFAPVVIPIIRNLYRGPTSP